MTEKQVQEKAEYKNIHERMLAIQMAMPKILKEKDGFNANFKYAPLPVLQKQVNEIANKFGLYVSFTYANNFNDPKVVQMRVLVRDVDGNELHWDSMPAIVAMTGRNNADESFGFGTKFQREVLQMAFGLVVEDESEAASDVTAGDAQIAILRDQIKTLADKNGKQEAEIESEILYDYRITKLEDLRSEQWGQRTRYLRDKIEAIDKVKELKELMKEYADLKNDSFEVLEDYVKSQSTVKDLSDLNLRDAESYIKFFKKKIKDFKKSEKGCSK